ncbi:N/A [soil metagenome]|jgi:ribosome maturation factor RimP
MLFNEQNIRALLEETLEDNTVYVVDVTVSDSPVKPKVTIKADSDEGISIDQCALLSRRLARKIEEAYGPEVSYVLEVTSPGLDHPLSSDRQYRRNIGRKLRILLKDGSEKTGTLDEVADDRIKLTEDVKGKNKKITPTPAEVSFEDIVKANIIISFK